MVLKSPFKPVPMIATEIGMGDEGGLTARYAISFTDESIDDEPVWIVRSFDTVTEAVGWFEAVAKQNGAKLFQRYNEDGSPNREAEDAARDAWFASMDDSLNTIFENTHSQIVLHHTSLIDGLLTRRLRQIMAPLNKDMRKRIFENYGPLSTLSAKIDLCYAFKVIDKPLHQELTTLRRIRNDFAHPEGAPNFSTPTVAEKCTKFADYNPEEAAFSNFQAAALSIMRTLAAAIREHDEAMVLPAHDARETGDVIEKYRTSP